MLPFYTKWLSPAEYGTADLITVYTTFLFCIFSCCIQDSIFIYPKGKNFEKQRKYFSSGFFFILSSLLVLALVFFVIYHFFRELPWLSFFNNYIWYIYVYIAVFLLQSYFQQFTRAIDKLVMYSLNGFFLVIITVIASVLWIPKYGVIGYVLAQIAGFGGAAFLLFFFGGFYAYLSFHDIRKKYLLQMLNYSIPLIPGLIMLWVLNALNRPLLAKYVGMTELGIFVIAMKFPVVLNTGFSMFGNSWQISVMEEFKKKDYSQYYNRILKVAFSIALFVAIILTVISPLAFHCFIDSRFHSGIQYIAVLMLWFLFSFTGMLIGTNFSAAKRSKYFLISSIVSMCSALIGNIVLIPFLGVWGAVWSLALSALVITVVRVFLASRYVKMKQISYYAVLLCGYLLFCILFHQGILEAVAAAIVLCGIILKWNWSDISNFIHYVF